VLTDGIRTVVRKREQIGIGPLAGGKVAVDLPALKRALEKIAPVFAQPARDAKPYMDHGAFHLFPGAEGRTVNVPATAERITALLTAKPTAGTLPVVEEKSAPHRTAEKLQRITGLLSTFETRTTANPNRNNNIAIASGKINGMILAPGETFSLNGTVGERTLAAGFRVAHVFVDAKVVDGIGGGVSQVTGTLFNAAALAGLEIKEVNPHSRPVAYLPLGRDATVAYGDKDLKFTNNTGAPIYIEYTFHKRQLRATLYGAPVPGRLISLRPNVQHEGAGKIDAQLYRVVKENGKIVRKEKLFSHSYRWDPSTPAP